MRLEGPRTQIVVFGRRLVTAHLTTGTGGNLSFFDRKEGLVAIKPSGVDYFEMKPEDVALFEPDGTPVEVPKKPSSETAMHLEMYRRRDDINAVVHTHSVFATTIACMGWELPAVHYLVGFSGYKVPLAAYATFGTDELARNTADALGSFNAVLMANHGLLAVGSSLLRAFTTAEEVELVAQIYVRAKAMGEPVILPREEMDIITGKFLHYGQK
ncbi:MAG: L-fuculose-phosphate aldolase [Synergistaceae bacterium]|nr:L-fuculose-phosphate aldolase [Synergistaceae bacterium]